MTVPLSGLLACSSISGSLVTCAMCDGATGEAHQLMGLRGAGPPCLKSWSSGPMAGRPSGGQARPC